MSAESTLTAGAAVAFLLIAPAASLALLAPWARFCRQPGNVNGQPLAPVDGRIGRREGVQRSRWLANVLAIDLSRTAGSSLLISR
jgi:hypothetical protein